MADVFTAYGKEDGVGLDHGDLGQAMCTMICMTHPQQHTVASMALAFNARPEDVRTAVDEFPWLFAAWPDEQTDPTKQVIETDGE